MARIDIGIEGTKLAAQTGTPDALFELGMLYATGLDVEVDLVVAHKWFNLAAMRGNRAALAYRKDIASEMTAAEIAEAQRLAREWLATEKLATEKLASETVTSEPVAAGLRGAERLAAERLAIEAFAAERFNGVQHAIEPVAPAVEVENAGRLAA